MTAERPMVFVIDDDQSIREALGSLLQMMGFDAGIYGSAAEFLAEPVPDRPCCLVLDVLLPGMNGLDFQADLAKSHPGLPIIFVTGHGDIPMSVRAMKAGAVEFLVKPFAEKSLLDAIAVALDQHRIRRCEDKALAELKSRYDLMSAREREIMAWVVLGGLNKQIAAKLNVSEITVKVHRGQVMRKMQAKSLVSLVRMADKLAIPAVNNDDLELQGEINSIDDIKP